MEIRPQIDTTRKLQSSNQSTMPQFEAMLGTGCKNPPVTIPLYAFLTHSYIKQGKLGVY